MSGQHRRLYGDSCDDERKRALLVSLRRADVIVTETDERQREFTRQCFVPNCYSLSESKSKMTSLCAQRQHTSIVSDVNR